MPELPEVQTTVNGLNRTAKGQTITAVTTTYKSPFYKGKDEIKNPTFFKQFRRLVVGRKIIKAERRAKNILIHISGGHTILVHMKMTGHFVYDRPDMPHIRLDFTLKNGRHLTLSDMRKFAKVTLVETKGLANCVHLQGLGPEPLEQTFTLTQFRDQILKRPRGRIKQVLMDQSLIAGIGNIYADEILWRAGVHPLSHPMKIPRSNTQAMFRAMKETLKKGVTLGGDSTSDYRNIEGKKGKFHETHRAYQRTGDECDKRGCKGIIERIMVGGRSAHFCPKHQKLFN